MCVIRCGDRRVLFMCVSVTLLWPHVNSCLKVRSLPVTSQSARHSKTVVLSVQPNSCGSKSHKEVTENRPSHALAGVISSVCAALFFFSRSSSGLPFDTDLLCLCSREPLYLASGPLHIVWKETICVLSWLTFFSLLFLPPALGGKKKGEYTIRARWFSVNLESPAVGLATFEGN